MKNTLNKKNRNITLIYTFMKIFGRFIEGGFGFGLKAMKKKDKTHYLSLLSYAKIQAKSKSFFSS